MPRTLAQNAQYIANTIKPAIKSAIEAQGVTVPSTDSFLDYADRIGEIEGGGSGYQLKDLPTGSISTVTDAAELPLNALKVSVEAWQEGTGDPSPSNIRPIHGWDSGEITVCGKNMFPINSGSGVGFIFGSGTATASLHIKLDVGEYYFSENFDNQGSGGATNIKVWKEEKNGTYTKVKDVTANSNQTVYFSLIVTESTQYSFNQYNNNVANKETNIQLEKSNQITTYEPYQGKQYTQQFPTTIYGAEWDVVSGGMKQTDGYIASYNGESLPSTWISDRDVYASGTTPTTGAEVVYKLATPTTIQLSPLSIRMLQGTNNLYTDCGEVIEGEYFVDEGAIDVRKVDYSIGSNSTLKISDGRILQGFASMSGYHARPLDASGNWLNVDWSKDFEIGVAFKFMAFPAYQSIFGDGNANSYRKAPRIYYDNSEGKLALCVSSDGSTLAIDTYLNYTFAVDKWYFIKAKFVSSTMTFTVDISDDFSTYTSLYSGVMASAPYHDTASLSLGGEAQQSNMASNTFLIDTFNTYIKGDGINWGASTGAFPS